MDGRGCTRRLNKIGAPRAKEREAWRKQGILPVDQNVKKPSLLLRPRQEGAYLRLLRTPYDGQQKWCNGPELVKDRHGHEGSGPRLLFPQLITGRSDADSRASPGIVRIPKDAATLPH